MKNDLQAGLQNIIDAINNLIEPKLDSLRYDKTFRAKIISDEGNNTYGVQINGKNYKAIYTGEKIPVGQIVKVKAPLNNFSDIYIETLPGSGSGSAGNYNGLLNKPILNTNNTGTQVPSATETIQGTISLHKVSKTGNYNDLLNKPTLDFIPTSEKGATNGVAGLDENKKVSKSNLPTDTVYDNNYVHTDNNFTTAMKNKLDSVEEGAEPNKIEIIQRNGSVLPINNKIVNVEVPTKTSDLTNDNGFISSIPVASDTILGGIKVGENLSITADGVLSAKGGGTTDYSVLLNKPVLNTANTKSLAIDSNETINGIVSLHKISKTGSYEDLLNKPTIPTKTSDLTNNGDGTTGSKYITNSDLNTELESKQDKITGGATTIVTNDLTVNRALVSNANGKVAVSNTTSTELGYLSGARSNLQNQIDAITTEGGQPNVIEVVQENGVPLEITNKTVNVTVPTNLENGIATGSLRAIGATSESNVYKLGDNSFAEGKNTKASGSNSHAEGYNTTASGNYSHAEGNNTKIYYKGFTIISGDEDTKTYTLKDVTGLESGMSFMITTERYTSGYNGNTITNVDTSSQTITVNKYFPLFDNNNFLSLKDYPDLGDTYLTKESKAAHAEGVNTLAAGSYSHAEGENTVSAGEGSHSEGGQTKASGMFSHAEGWQTQARGYSSHSEGHFTISNADYQHVQGKYNISDDTSLDIIGNGTGANARSNAYTLDGNGNAWYSGDIYIGSTSGTNKDAGSKKVATEEYVNNKVVTDYDKLTNRPTLNTNVTTSQPVSASEIITGKMVLHKISKTGDYNDLNNKLNIMNGSAMGSLRTVGATAEDSKYKLGRYAFAEGGTAIGYKSHTEGAGVTGSFAFTIISGDSTAKTYTLSNVTGLTVGMLYSIQYGNTIARDAGTITAINSSTKTITVDTYKTLGTKDNYLFILQSPGLGDISYDEGEYAHAEGTGVAVGDYSHAEGHNTKALWASSHAEGESTIARGWRSHAEGYGTVANGRNQHASGTYNIADNRYLVIVGNGSSDSSRSNAYTLDTNGNAWYSGEVYVGSTSGTHKDSGSKKLITLDEIPIASSRILGLVKVGSGLGIGTDGTLNVTGGPVVLYSNNSGSNGTITLSQTAANFSYLEIIYFDDHSNHLSTGKISAPNGKIVVLSTFPIYSASNTVIANSRRVTISSTSISTNNSGDYYGAWSSWNNSISATNNIKIIKVLGYK